MVTQVWSAQRSKRRVPVVHEVVIAVVRRVHIIRPKATVPVEHVVVVMTLSVDVLLWRRDGEGGHWLWRLWRRRRHVHLKLRSGRRVGRHHHDDAAARWDGHLQLLPGPDAGRHSHRKRLRGRGERRGRLRGLRRQRLLLRGGVERLCDGSGWVGLHRWDDRRRAWRAQRSGHRLRLRLPCAHGGGDRHVGCVRGGGGGVGDGVGGVDGDGDGSADDGGRAVRRIDGLAQHDALKRLRRRVPVAAAEKTRASRICASM
eukprot:4423340-Pleurochrysis_carterae.AAC.4